jgi:hypothetical protein
MGFTVFKNALAFDDGVCPTMDVCVKGQRCECRRKTKRGRKSTSFRRVGVEHGGDKRRGGGTYEAWTHCGYEESPPKMEQVIYVVG